jgi:hypothetical protein
MLFTSNLLLQESSSLVALWVNNLSTHCSGILITHVHTCAHIAADVMRMLLSCSSFAALRGAEQGCSVLSHFSGLSAATWLP